MSVASVSVAAPAPGAATFGPIDAQSTRRTPFASITRGAAALLSTQPLTWAATFLTTVFVPRFLGAEGLGQYSVALTLAGIAGMAAAGGVPDYLRRRVATHERDAQADAGAALLSLTLLSLAVAVVVGAALLTTRLFVSDPAVLSLALCAMVITTAQSVFFSFLVGQERHGYFAWINAVSVIVTAGLGIGALALGGGVVGYAAASLAATALTLGISWAVSGLRLTPASLDVSRWRALLVGGLPFMGWNVAIRIRCQIDVLVVGALLGEHAAGWLAGAYRVIAVPFFIPNLVAVPLLPALSRCAQNESPEVFRHTLRRSLAIVLALTIPLSALMIGVAPAIPNLLGWGAEFENTIPLVMLLALAQPLAASDIVLGTGLFALSRERVWVRVAALAAVFNPALNVALVPLFDRATGNGAIGAAVVEGLTELNMFAGALLLLPRGVLDRWMAGFCLRILAAGAALGLTAWWLLPVGIVPAAVAAGIVFLAAAAALGVVRPIALWRHRRDPFQAFEAAIATPPLLAAPGADVGATIAPSPVAQHPDPGLLATLRGDIVAWARLWAYEGTADASARATVRLAARFLWQHVGFRAVLLHRIAHALWRARVRAVPQLVSQLNVMLHGLDIPASVAIGPGLYIPHPVGTVVMARRIGRDVTLVSNVTIGLRHKCEFPVVGDGVYLGAGARVLGPIRLGHGAKVGANAVVLEDVPDGATAVGVPARIIPSCGLSAP